MSDSFVFDVTGAEFESKVLQRSSEVPVLLDFHAAWCGPCKTLGPVLEQLAADYGGGFLLGKVDTEVEQELAYAFQVQSIPLCVLLVDGRPVDGFAGALPVEEVKAFLDKHGVKPAAGEAEAEIAEDAVDPDAPAQRLRDGMAAALRGDAGTAEERLGGIGEEEPEYPRAERIREGLAIWADLPAADPEQRGAADARAAVERGIEALRSGDLDGAVESWIESIQADKEFAGGLARRAAVLCFELMSLEPDGNDRASGFRRRMATLLY